MGSAQATPGAAAIEQAQGLLTRLIASGAVVALNLLGAVSEQPDFLAHSEALPFVLALRARPGLEACSAEILRAQGLSPGAGAVEGSGQDGALTAAAARETLGRELTEAAVLRALCELWQGLRISPVFAERGPARTLGDAAGAAPRGARYRRPPPRR